MEFMEMETSENLHIQVGTQYHEINTYLYLYSWFN